MEMSYSEILKELDYLKRVREEGHKRVGGIRYKAPSISWREYLYWGKCGCVFHNVRDVIGMFLDTLVGGVPKCGECGAPLILAIERDYKILYNPMTLTESDKKFLVDNVVEAKKCYKDNIDEEEKKIEVLKRGVHISFGVFTLGEGSPSKWFDHHLMNDNLETKTRKFQEYVECSHKIQGCLENIKASELKTRDYIDTIVGYFTNLREKQSPVVKKRKERKG